MPIKQTESDKNVPMVTSNEVLEDGGPAESVPRGAVLRNFSVIADPVPGSATVMSDTTVMGNSLTPSEWCLMSWCSRWKNSFCVYFRVSFAQTVFGRYMNLYLCQDFLVRAVQCYMTNCQWKWPNTLFPLAEDTMVSNSESDLFGFRYSVTSQVNVIQPTLDVLSVSVFDYRIGLGCVKCCI